MRWEARGRQPGRRPRTSGRGEVIAQGVTFPAENAPLRWQFVVPGNRSLTVAAPIRAATVRERFPGREGTLRNLIFLSFAAIRMVSAQTALPAEWIDPDTGHRVIRLSKEPGTASLYFHQNAYSADGKKLVVTNPHGIATINLATREIDQVVEGRVNILVTGHKTGQIYYTKQGAIFAPIWIRTRHARWPRSRLRRAGAARLR